MQLFVLKNTTLAPVCKDAQWLLNHRALPFLVQSLPPHTLYLILQKQNLQENLELVEWLRGKQLQKILDFDIWEFNPSLQTEDISSNAMAWIQAWLTLGKPFTADRFFNLEEETALLILTKFLTILPEGISHITDDIRENWTMTPDKRFFIKPISEDGTEFEILTAFIDALYGTDMQKAGLLFSSASLLIRQETLELAQKWRRGRLSDQGFIPTDEAISLLFSKVNTPVPLLENNHVCEPQFLTEDASENIFDFLSSMDSSDAMHLIKQVLGKNDIQQITGSQNIHLEQIYDDNESIQDCINHIVKNTNKIFNQLEHVQTQSIDHNLLIEKALQKFLEMGESKFLILKQKIAYISNTAASILSENPYHDNIVNTALMIVRGCLNIGIEYSIEPCENSQFQNDNVVQKGILSIEQFGIDYIFKLGFNAVIGLQKNLIQFLFENKLISSKTFNSAKNWIKSDSLINSNEVRLVLEGLMKQIPMCHNELLIESPISKEPVYLSQKFKPFEHKSEIIHAQKFIQNIKYNLHQDQNINYAKN